MDVLSLCDYSGTMVKPWLEAGFHATTVDIRHRTGARGKKVGNGWLTQVGADILEWEPYPEFYIVFAFPPCTHLANSGAAWFQQKGLSKLIEGLTLVERCRHLAEDVIGASFMIENPVGQLSTWWRKPDYMFDPCDYGDPWTKRTCLWTGNGFVMPPKSPVDPVTGSKANRMGETKARTHLRSATPPGFAQAVFEANKPCM